MPIDFESLSIYAQNLYYNHTIAAIALAVVVFLLFCFRPKAMLKVAGLILAFAVAAYIFSLAIDMAGVGRSQKSEMIHTVE